MYLEELTYWDHEAVITNAGVTKCVANSFNELKTWPSNKNRANHRNLSVLSGDTNNAAGNDQTWGPRKIKPKDCFLEAFILYRTTESLENAPITSIKLIAGVFKYKYTSCLPIIFKSLAFPWKRCYVGQGEFLTGH